MPNSQMKIFLVEPINKRKFKPKIVLTANSPDARIAAAASENPNNTLSVDSILEINQINLPEGQVVYLNAGMSICIQLDSEIIDILEDHGESMKVKYHDVIYNLQKNVAEDVLSESII